jgi:hypothetical protein
LSQLIARLLKGEERTLRDSRSQIQASRVNRQLIVYRYGVLQFWYDLDAGLRSWAFSSNAEVRAYNRVVPEGTFVKAGKTVLYRDKGGKLWTSSDWSSSH